MPREIDTKTIQQLSRIDALERSFVACYEAVIAQITDPYVRQQVEECRRSHQMRADILVEEIEDLGGHRDLEQVTAEVSMGDVSNGSIDEAAALARLLVLEDLVLAGYRVKVIELDYDVRDLVEGDLIPEQERTQAIIASLQVDANANPDGPQG